MSTQKDIAEPSFLDYKEDIKAFFLDISTDHKRIALLYLYSILSFFAIGATLGY